MNLNNTIFSICILTLLLSLSAYSQTAADDEVHWALVPGYGDHKWFSGYLHFDMGKFHYVFFQSKRDPSNDPLVLWLNGGPGCSSLIGMVYQNGPFTFKTQSSNFELNQFSWNRKANVLYLQSPGGVGFSHGLRNNNNTDETVARDNHQALLQFFNRFPTYKKNDFYISGQSYAGVYVPTLAWEIVQYNKLPNRQMTINLKGIMVGNACTDPRECYEPGADANVSIYQYEYLYNHGFYTERQYDDIRGACMLGYHSDACNEVRDIMDKKFAATNTSLLNIYLPCYYNKPTQKKFKILQSGKKLDLADFVDCDDHVGIDDFFNEPMTHERLHVDPIHYEMCSDVVADKYTVGQKQSYYLYPLLIKEKLRIWVYSGDNDADVPITGTLRWLQTLRTDQGLPIEEPWRQWWVQGLHQHEDQVGGMVWTLRGLTFASVKGAGHMVPKDQKKAAYVLFNSFIDGVQLPFKDE